VKEYDNNNRGVLFKNDKGGNDKRPDYRGSAVIDGVDLNISAWIKRSQKTGDAYMSLSFEPKKAAAPKRAPVMDETPFKDDADLPF
jgi:uncharacterized protein (DUF736 family)